MPSVALGRQNGGELYDKDYPRFSATARAIWTEPNRPVKDDLNTLAQDLNQLLDDFNRTPAGKK